MAFIQMNFYSSELMECTAMNVIVPEKSLGAGVKLPILWLLPPSGNNQASWGRYTDIEYLCRDRDVLIAMPNMRLSYGTDMVHGSRFFSMLTKELPALLEQYFPVDVHRQFICGAEEGGYAALRAAFTCRGQYDAAACFSCGNLIDEAFSPVKEREFNLAFGMEDHNGLKGTEYDIFHLAKESAKSSACLPRIYLAYGREDSYKKTAQQMAEFLKKEPIEFDCKIEASEGILGWRDWNGHLDHFLEWVIPVQ
jgi:putative tributyrin esterase